MIVSSLGQAALYISANERFKQVFEYIKNTDLFALEPGRYDIDGDNIYLMITGELDLKKPEAAKLEVHDKYIDIQLPLTAEEGFGWSQRSDCTSVIDQMDTVKDIMFYQDVPSSFVKVHPGQFIVFYPSDAHAPMIGEGTIRKCVIKVLA